MTLDGNAGNLRAIASSSALFSQEFLASAQQFRVVLADAPPVLDTLAADGPQLQQGLADTAVLVQVLADRTGDLVRLLGQGAGAAQALKAVVSDGRPDLACVLHDAAAVSANLALAANLADLGTALRTNQLFFGAVAAISPTGPAKALTSQDQTRTDQEWLRTRLLLPPAQPSADAYSRPVTLPPVLPGAACDTEFGHGAPAPTQAGFTPTGPNAELRPAGAAEAEVRGGGSPDPSVAPAVARLGPTPGPSSLPAIAAAAAGVVASRLATLGFRRRRPRSGRAVRGGIDDEQRDEQRRAR